MNQFERIENEMNDFIPVPGTLTGAIQVDNTPKQAKGGVFAPADIDLIKDALRAYVCDNHTLSTAQERQVVNLLHRLTNRI